MRRDREAAVFRAAAALLILLSLVPVRGVFTASRVFFVRDLGFFFWSRHLWLRHTIFAGELPLWDPFSAGGHAAYADALNQVFMPVTLALRLLPSAVVSFNLWVAMPLPVAMIGMFLFLRRRLSMAASALGACAFALSGTLVSSLNAPNLSWSLALLPWLCFAGDRLVEQPGRRTAVFVAVVAALQALSGEPVTLAASVVVLIVHVASAARHDDRRVPQVLPWLFTGLVLGAALSAAQMLPTVIAGIRAGRGTWSETPDFWSLHPLAALEAVVPHLFGNYYTSFLADMPWMTTLNSGREPFFYSLYVGPLVVLMACAGIVAAPRRSAPWLFLLVLFGIAAMGNYTPLYPAARRAIPALAFFRFPIKYSAVACFALAVLAAEGSEAVIRTERETAARRLHGVAVAAGALAVTLSLVLVVALLAPSPAWQAARGLAHQLQLEAPDAGAAFLLAYGEPLAARSIGTLLVGAALLALAADPRQPRRRIAWMVLLTLCAGDLVVSNGGLNPTIAESTLRPPEWYLGLAGRDRVYVGGRVRGFMDADDIDGSPGWDLPPEPSAIAARAVLNAELPMESSGWRVREALSYDLPILLPSAYRAVVGRFVDAGPAERDAFLRRSGVRWCVLPEDRANGAVIAAVPDWHMAVTICSPLAARVFVPPSVDDAATAQSQQDALFDPHLADTVARVDRLPHAAGRQTAAAASSSVAITGDFTNEVDLTAMLTGDGVIVLRDAFDPGWRAFIDGDEAPIVRANALYRAVHVRGGTHVIRFVYRPRILAAGLILSGTAIVACLLLSLPRRRRRAAAGFTLIELMVVMALIGILLAIAFARYEGMRARANETSAASSLQTIAAAQWTFALTCGHDKYATTLPALAQPIPSTGQGFLSPDLTSAEQIEHSGYLFQMAAKPLDDAMPSCSGVPVAQGYAVTADPVKPGVSGNRFFAVNTDRVVYVDEKQTFTGNMPESGAPEHGLELK
ncbi:MAG TPA: prepilin-type N-terminal cleavage/methylation domain-containing protein [Vicinamibacterales bacterium]|nr:prepilin-type N-terminal cleavage/methylation domain-containing protein [Vicinamibacterales bacterium]